MFKLALFVRDLVKLGRSNFLRAFCVKVSDPVQFTHCKLSEKTDAGSCRPKGVRYLQHCVADKPTDVSVTTNSSVLSRGILNLLRPFTSRIVHNLTNRVATPIWHETKRRQLFGQTAPYFALVGVTLATGSERGLLTAQDELEAVCGDIREAISRAGWIHNPDYWKEENVSTSFKNDSTPSKEYSVEDFDIGPVISKGANAVVYSARWKKNLAMSDILIPNYTTNSKSSNATNLINSVDNIFPNQSLWSINRLHSDGQKSGLQPLDEAGLANQSGSFSQASSSQEMAYNSLHNSSDELLNNSLDNSANGLLNLSGFGSVASFDSQKSLPLANLTPTLASTSRLAYSNVDLLLASGGYEPKPSQKKKVKFKEELPQIHGAEGETSTEKNSTKQTSFDSNPAAAAEAPNSEFPLALKMLFNYEAESNAPAILTAMYKEMLPASVTQLDETASLWKSRLVSSSASPLPPHPNVVDMPCVFVDRVPHLRGGLSLYPDALPRRINPSGSGRNMSLFCVMKRYDCTLGEFLSGHRPTVRTSLLLFTQLLEAVLHLNKYGVAHRDLKSDNLLLCLREGAESPHLVVSDFGCCLPQGRGGLSAPFPSYEADPRLGNAALMAPEIKCASPGLLTRLDYSRADLWAAGALAYEIFGLENPFCGGGKAGRPPLDSASFRESQLPRLPKAIPPEVRRLVYDLLKRNPKQRPSPTVAATVCQLSLWAPRKWLSRHAITLPSNDEVMRWLLCLSTKVICEAGSAPSTAATPSTESGRGSNTATATSAQSGHGQLEYETVSTFLRRVRYGDIVQSLKWVRAF